MMKVVKSKRTLSKATRWFTAAAVVLSISSLQSTWASVTSLCEAASQPEACHCKHACESTGAMHHQQASRPSPRPAMHFPTINADSNASERSGSSCCSALPQGDRSVVITSTQEAALETKTASFFPVVEPVALASIRVHDPPDTRRLYLTNSCLLI